MKSYILTILTASTIILTSCESKAGTGALVGGGLGVGAGALIGGGQGALIGGAVGVVGGALIGHALDEEDQQKIQNQNPQTARRIHSGEQLSVNDIIALHQAGISDEKIINLIEKTGSYYNLSTSSIHRLERAGVSDSVINYMIKH
ncbi:MAG: glycine zipper domain-containing protein [Chlamydiota bacterium]